MVRKFILDKKQCLREDSVGRAFLTYFKKSEPIEIIKTDISQRLLPFTLKLSHLVEISI